MTAKESASDIRQQLKALGISAKQVSVRSNVHAINCSVKDLTINPKVVKGIAEKFSRIFRCERSGEILSGGNTFVNVTYDWQAVSATQKSEEFQNHLTEIAAKLTEIEGNSGVEVVPGLVVFKDIFNGRYQATAKWAKDEYWLHFNDARGVAFEAWTARAQGLTQF